MFFHLFTSFCFFISINFQKKKINDCWKMYFEFEWKKCFSKLNHSINEHLQAGPQISSSRRLLALFAALSMQFGPHFAKQISSLKVFFIRDTEWDSDLSRIGHSPHGGSLQFLRFLSKTIQIHCYCIFYIESMNHINYHSNLSIPF